MNSLDASGFTALVRSGHACLREHVDNVNALNVFPVPDGDTGTNMELSLASGVRSLSAAGGQSLYASIQAFNKGLLMGARGNSGVILSQLFRGFLHLESGVQQLDARALAHALNEGVQVAYKAVSKPVEGTILTVAREAAAAGIREAKPGVDLARWFEAVYSAAARALAKTPTLLAVLREANVVDSGGQGLVYVYEGFLRYVSGTEAPMRSEEHTTSAVRPSVSMAFDHHQHEAEFGYCTEVLIRLEGTAGGSVDRVLSDTLAAHGDSMLVVQADDLVKVHIHTLHPGRVLEEALRYGPLVQIKIENMTEQNAALHAVDAPPDELVGESVTPKIAVIATVCGDGLKAVFESLGAAWLVDGGATMNPSTEELVRAVETTGASQIMILPNHKNVKPSALQVKELVTADVRVLDTESIVEGIAAMVAFHPDKSIDENEQAMNAAADAAVGGQVVRAARDATYQNQEIKMGQFLGMCGSALRAVTDTRDEAATHVLSEILNQDAELVTVFYGADVSEADASCFAQHIEDTWDVAVELRNGGQPIYDYIFGVE